MIATARRLKRTANRHAGKLLLGGLTTVGAYNWRLWQCDKMLADRLRHDWPLVPVLSRTPKVSALVAAWNEHAHIDAHLRSFLALAYPDIELVLCAGGADDTLERAWCYACDRIIVLEQYTGEGKQRALARCLEHATGEIIYLTDADCRYSDEALVRLLAPLVDEGESATTGNSRPLDEQRNKLLPAYLWASTVMSSVQGSDYSEGLLGRNAAITRQAIARIGGLDFVARTGTDYQLARRLIAAGIRIRYVRPSIVSSEFPESLVEYRRRQSRWLRNLLIYGRRYGVRNDVKVTTQTVATGTLMTLMPLAAFAVGSTVLAIWSVLVAHAATSKLRYILFTSQLYRQTIQARLLAILVPLTVIDFVIWAFPLLDLANPRKREQW